MQPLIRPDRGRSTAASFDSEVDYVLDLFMSGHFPVCWLISSAVDDSDLSGSTQPLFNLPEASPSSHTRLMINGPLKAYLLDVTKAYDKV